MPINALFVLDPPDQLDPPTDTSLALMRESRRRGQAVFATTLDGLFLAGNRPAALARAVEFQPGEDLFGAGEARELDLAEDCAVVWMRKDPPVDLAYLHATLILDRLPPHVVQVNPARALRDFCEKLAPGLFPDLQPESLVSAAPGLLAGFATRHERIVVKPLEECSGRGVVLLEQGQPDLVEQLNRATANGTRFVQAQRFLPAIFQGDIRVLLLGGEILGSVRRRPPAGSFRSNVNAGGHCEPVELGSTERTLCARLKPWLQRHSIHLAGIDIVGRQVLEINITSPSCLREINQIYGLKLEEAVLDHVEDRLRG